MSVSLVDVTRGAIVESRHRGYVVVADGSGKVIASAGLPGVVTYMRSSAKPIQALNVIFSGAAEQFDLNEKELAIMCASHYGEEMHREVIYRILNKLGLSVKDLGCGASLSINREYMQKQLFERHVIDQSNSDCSGKHCGFLAVCKTKGYPIEGYSLPGHPVQREVLGIMSYMCGIDESAIGIGVDGCGVPVHSMPLVNMAAAYARLSSPGQLSDTYRAACERIFSVMNAAPEMVAGTNGFCTQFLKNTGGRFCAKLGAEALYCIGVKDKNMGIAVKVEDGNYRALYPAVMSALIQLDLLSRKETDALAHYIAPDNNNNLGNTVGKIIPTFNLW